MDLLKIKRRDYSHMDLLCDKAGFGKPASVKLSQYLVLWAPTPLCPALVSACIKFRGNFFFSVSSIMKKDEY